jgi:prolyl oligopeptidase PreP (S9A serine peptidase family)
VDLVHGVAVPDPYRRLEDGGGNGVDPAHARTFGAALQAATSCGDERPVFVRGEARAGHGHGTPASTQAEEAADVWAFLRWQLGR